MRSKQAILLTCLLVVIAAGGPSLPIPLTDAEAAEGRASILEMSPYRNRADDDQPTPSIEFDSSLECNRGSQAGSQEGAVAGFDSCAAIAISAFDGGLAPSLAPAKPDRTGKADPARFVPVGGQRLAVADAACATDIFLAVFFQSPLSRTGSLLVAATSPLASGTGLELVGYGPMKLDRQSEMWVIRVPNLEANPGVVKVESAECVVLAPILTVPSGDDQMLPAVSRQTVK